MKVLAFHTTSPESRPIGTCITTGPSAATGKRSSATEKMSLAMVAGRAATFARATDSLVSTLG
jgi:hypothetical protein